MQKTEDYFRAVNGCLGTMQGTNSFMTMTINRCVDYTKASKGFKLVPKLETVSLQAALEMPVQLMRDVQDTIEIQVLPLSAEVCLHVITDKQWLIENLLCLLSNAVKYSHKGCVQVSIRLDETQKTSQGEKERFVGATQDEAETEDHDQQQMLRVEVQDTGIGLSDEAMQGLFNPFKQAQRLAGGTGLGLFSLAKRIEALQGQYGVSGRPDGDQGSLFWFTIPFRPDNLCFSLASRSDSSTIFAPPTPSDSPSFSIRKRAPSATVPFLSPRAAEPPRYNVLVVDDAPLIVKMTTLLLKRKGHTVQHAVNGADALEKLLVRMEAEEGGGAGDGEDDGERVRAGLDGSPRSSAQEMPAPPQFDVVLMDLQMPVLDGIEAIRRLRAAEARRDRSHKQFDAGTVGGSGSGDEGGPPLRQCVIALSANSDEETKQEALAAGADLFIPKPFTYESFIDAVSSLVRVE
jgi:CheY-like chemotaxis protein